jgi:hypothetical protein
MTARTSKPVPAPFQKITSDVDRDDSRPHGVTGVQVHPENGQERQREHPFDLALFVVTLEQKQEDAGK